MDDLKCADCDAVFCIDTVEESSESSIPGFCPFCGSTQICTIDSDDDDDVTFELDEKGFDDED
jgi:hypothetical protein